MNARMLTRNIMIAKRRTTVRLEAAVWDALDDICSNEGVTRHELCTRIDQARGEANRAQAVRATVINYFRLALKPSFKTRIIDQALLGVDNQTS